MAVALAFVVLVILALTGHFALGVLIPGLPLVGSRSRGATRAAISFLCLVAAVIALGMTLPPEEPAERRLRQEAEAERERARELKEAEALKARRVAEDARWRKVDLRTLLADYEENEIGADAKYKGVAVEVVGQVREAKKDILSQPYVTVGTGGEFEIPVLQCALSEGSVERAATLRRDQHITIRATIQGLMFNVQAKGCEIR